MKVYLEDLKQSGIIDFDQYFTLHPDKLKHCAQMVNVIDVNAAALQLFEAGDKKQFITNHDLFIVNGSLQIFKKGLTALIAGKKDFVSDIAQKTKNGSLFRVMMHMHVPDSYSDNWQRVLISMSDITDQKRTDVKINQLNRELEQRILERTSKLELVNKELNEFAYIVSHDLKAPLRGISQLAYWIAEDYAKFLDDKGNELIDLLKDRVKRMDSLIDGILRYSRLGSVRQNQEEVDINQLLTDVIETLATPKHIKIIRKKEFPVITGDYIRLAQVFQNLLGNAIKYNDKDIGEIKIDVYDKNTQWLFTIEDNGVGIDPKYHRKIFQIFQTLNIRDEQGGTGIGLTLVKKIIELHGGNIWVESDVAKPTTFSFTLPKMDRKK